MDTIVLNKVTKTLGKTKRIDDFSFSVKSGEIFALLGPNGAGKTTVIKLITGMLKADVGEVKVMGLDPIKDKKIVRTKIGLVPQETALYPELSAYNNLEFHAALYLPKLKKVKERIHEILELVELNERYKEPVGTFSGGMKRRLAIGRALLTDPEILLLDEPTLGVDVQGTHKIWEYIKQFSALGKTVLVTTNIMQEADFYSDQISIMDHGKKIIQGSSLELKNQLGEDKIVISLKSQNNIPVELIRAKAGDFRLENNNLIFSGNCDGQQLAKLLQTISEITEIQGVEMKKPSLDDVFLFHTGRSLRD